MLLLFGRITDPIVPFDKALLSEDFEWDNYYDKDDVLGWPLSPLSDGYKALVNDYNINAGGIFTSWTPWSHGKYWTDKNVTKPLLRKVNSCLSQT